MHHEICCACARCLAKKAGVASGLWMCPGDALLFDSVIRGTGRRFCRASKATRRGNPARDASVSGTRVHSSSSSSSDLHVTLRLLLRAHRNNENGSEQGSGFAGDALGFTHAHRGVAERYKLLLCCHDFEFGRLFSESVNISLQL